jgi:hypothetical protein
LPAPPDIQRLVEQFAHNEQQYTHPDYNETDARTEFIDRFFAALGWDVTNRQGLAPDLRDVLRAQTFRKGQHAQVQDPDDIIGKRHDYTFRIAQKPRFYVEARKPAEDIAHSAKYAYEVRSYGCNTRLSFPFQPLL